MPRLQVLFGCFEQVRLVKKRGTDELYAMKKLRKSEMIKKDQVGTFWTSSLPKRDRSSLLNQVQHVLAERDLLSQANNPWVVKLHYSFQDGYAGNSEFC